MAERGTEGSHQGQEHYGRKGRGKRNSCWISTSRRLQKSHEDQPKPQVRMEPREQVKPLNKCYLRAEILLTSYYSPFSFAEYFLFIISGHLHNTPKRSIKEVVFTFIRWGNWSSKMGMTYLKLLCWLVAKQNFSLPERPRLGGRGSQIGINGWVYRKVPIHGHREKKLI